MNRAKQLSAVDKTRRKLVKSPETLLQIYELAESLFLREDSLGMSLAEIEQVNRYLRQVDADIDAMKRQLHDLAAIENGFCSAGVPVGF